MQQRIEQLERENNTLKAERRLLRRSWQLTADCREWFQTVRLTGGDAEAVKDPGKVGLV